MCECFCTWLVDMSGGRVPSTYCTHIRRGKFSTNLSSSGRIRHVQNTTNHHNFCTMNLNSTRISTVRGHAPYKYPPRNTMPKSPSTNSNPLRISWSHTSFPPTDWYISCVVDMSSAAHTSHMNDWYIMGYSRCVY